MQTISGRRARGFEWELPLFCCHAVATSYPNVHHALLTHANAHTGMELVRLVLIHCNLRMPWHAGVWAIGLLGAVVFTPDTIATCGTSRRLAVITHIATAACRTVTWNFISVKLDPDTSFNATKPPQNRVGVLVVC